MITKRIKSIFAVLAILLVMMSNAAPAMADGPWGDCTWTWHWSWFWGYYLTCDAVDDWEPASSDWTPVSSDWEPSGDDWESASDDWAPS
jgi:hypothetical protein